MIYRTHEYLAHDMEKIIKKTIRNFMSTKLKKFNFEILPDLMSTKWRNSN